MSIEQYRSKIKSSIWQAIAQSGSGFEKMPSEQQNKFVDDLANNLLLEMDDFLGEISSQKSEKDSQVEDDEQILWEGRPFMSLVEFYTITNERIKVMKGLIGKDLENYELIRVQDIDVSQNMSERIFGMGDITISGADASAPVIVLRNIQNVNEVYETLRKAWLAARKKYGLVFREEM